MRSILLLIAVLLNTGLFAQHTVVKTGSELQPGTVLEAIGTRYLSSKASPDVQSRPYWVESAYGLVKLSYALPKNATTRPIGVATVAFSVNYEIEEHGNFVPVSTTSQLTIDLSTSGAKDIAFFKIEGAQKMVVQILPTGTSIPVQLQALNFETSVVTNDFVKLNANAITSGFTLSHNLNLTADGNLQVSWTEIPGASHYELEWTYVSNQDTVVNQTLLPHQVKVDRFVFRNNSSRVEVKGLTYQIPMIYEKGIILYRVRGVGKNVANSKPVPFKTNWTVNDEEKTFASDYPNLFEFVGHEQLINWQSSLSFAEEGKNKLVLSYHDGSSRNRQAVTRINSDQRAIVGETFYDFNGRPVIQLLPVPVTQNAFSFYPNFNLIEGKNKVEKIDYDQAEAGDGCAPVGPVFDTTTGASQYYSPGNPFGTNGNVGNNLLNKHLIPDAEKYPYTQTLYTPDNTGRIAAQSGVGSTHNIGSNRETKYFYGSPQQPELTRLFGNQVGHASHYKKNVVIDPNKQVSVSYLDLDGKVVATALAGGAPTNVTRLPGDFARHINTDLLRPLGANSFSLDSLSITYNSKFVVTGQIDYTFNYSGRVGTYSLQCMRDTNQAPNVFDGVVQAEVRVVDNCGQVIPQLSGIVETTSGTTGNNQNLAISNLSKRLEPGEYQIFKVLSIDQEKLEAYWQDYLATGNCLLTDRVFVDEELAKIDIRGCGLTCAKCNAEVDSVASTLPPAEVTRLRNACKELCLDEAIGCRASLEGMIGDFNPEGQYGQIRPEKLTQPSAPVATLDANNQPVLPAIDITMNNADGVFDAGNAADNVIDPRPFPLSIFNDDNFLRTPEFLKGLIDPRSEENHPVKPSWRFPLQVVMGTSYTKPNWRNQALYSENLSAATYAFTEYKDRNGDTVYAYIKQVTGGATPTYEPAVWSDAEKVAVDVETGQYKIPVRYLNNFTDFYKYWKGHFASYLVPYHPEFEYLIHCSMEKASHDYDYFVLGATELQPAIDSSYLSAGGIPQLFENDPFFIGKPDQSRLMRAKMTNYYREAEPAEPNDPIVYKVVDGQPVYKSMLEMTNYMVNCPTLRPECSSNCSDGKITNMEEWNVYKALYIAEKQKIMRDLASNRAVTGLYYNGCIGHADYLTKEPDAKYLRQVLVYDEPVTLYNRECNTVWESLISWYRPCNLVPYTINRNVYAWAWRHPGQLCNTTDAHRYFEKSQRFFPQMSSGTEGGQVPEHCTTYMHDDQGVLEVSIPCDEDLRENMQNATDAARRFKFESCGQCPVASDLELLFMRLQQWDLLVSENLVISCDGPDYPVTVGLALKDKLIEGQTSITWNAVLSTDSKILTGTFKGNTGTTLATVTLTLPTEATVNFNTIGRLCCMDVIEQGTSDAYNFTMEFYDPSLKRELKVQGVMTTVPLAPCTFPPKCVITDDATRASLFLNVLATHSSYVDDKVSHLHHPSTALALTTGANYNYYNDALRSLLRKDVDTHPGGYIQDMSGFNPTWSSSIATVGTTEIMTGYLNYTGGAITIKMCGLTSTEYNQVLEFSNLRAVTAGVTTCIQDGTLLSQPFTADAMFISTNAAGNPVRTYKRVTIYLPSLDPVMCTELRVPSN